MVLSVLERRGVSQDVTLDIKIGIEAKNYEGVSPSDYVYLKNIFYILNINSYLI